MNGEEWVFVEDAAVFCGETILANQTIIQDCDLWVNLGVPTYMNMLKFTNNATSDIMVTPTDDGSLSFENTRKTLELIQYEDGSSHFRLSQLVN